MHSISITAALAATLFCSPSNAFKIDPWSYRPPGVSPLRIEAQLESFIHNPRMLLLGPIAFGSRLPAAMGQLKEATHENLTDLSIRCALAPLARADADAAPASVPASVPGSASALVPALAPNSGTAPAGMITRCAGREGALLTSAHDLSDAHYKWFTDATHSVKSPVTLGAQVIDLMLLRKAGWNDPISGTAGPSVAQWVRDALFPITTPNAARVAGAGAPFLRTRAPAAPAINPDAPAAALHPDDCKE